ncbi:MFS transporter [Pseudalkalibacillus hwajinpoensis]|uniref:MFS transporter n=1 Tax=Guptibacillus hwajinpoensis TaxID=208199 RepID=UPI001CD1B506|nr:MFS transporter [Pseudalkalibacillus hwajinpoensis]MCA0991456.1 MFS transporter [Pseudalkalibacillus hwajinpoensis]
MKSSNLKRYFQFMLIVLAAGAIFPLIYLRTNYQGTILEVYGMSLSQLNSIFSVLGVAFIIGYFPSGWISDRFSAKKLISVSLLFVGLAGIWFAQVPSYPVVILIFAIWGIFSVLTFWAAHLKLVKLISKKEEEGRFFGILDGGRGVVEATLASIAVFIFSRVLGSSTAVADKQEALVNVIYLYSGVLIAVSILIMLFVDVEDHAHQEPEKAEKTEQKGAPLNLATLKKVFGNKFVWLLGGIIFMSYIVTWTVYYFGGFLETNVGMSASIVGTITVTMLWMRPIGGVVGGFLGDKFGKSSILIIALGLATLFLTAVSILPTTLPHFYFGALIILSGLSVYTIRGLYWALLGDCDIDDDVLGLSIGLVSFVGYLPDILLPLVMSLMLSTFGDAGGYNAYFIFSAVAGVLGIFITVIFKTTVNRNVAHTEQESHRSAV